MNLLESTGTACAIFAVAGQFTHRLRPHHIHGLFAVEFALFAIDDLRDRDSLWALCETAACAYFAWRWWHGGGGDDMKRRLRRWARRFTPVRRTAPAGAS
jgi:hypothetical protein